MSDPGRNRALRLATYIVYLVAVYMALEVVIALTGVLLPPEQVRLFSDFYRPDSLLGFAVRPNLDRFAISWFDGDVRAEYSTDSLGFRNIGRNYATARYYFIGDSFTFGSWVAREKTFYGLLEKQLGEDVITLGVGGYGITQYHHLVKRSVPPSDFDKTVFLCTFANDLTMPLSAAYLRDFYENAGWQAYQKNAALIDRLSLRRTLTYHLLLNTFNTFWGTGRHRPLDNGLTLYQYRGASKTYLENQEYVPFEKVFNDIVSCAASRDDINLVVLLLPSKESVYSDEYTKAFGTAGYLDNETSGYTRLKRLSADRSVPVLDLTDHLRAHDGEVLYFAQDPHCNERGHELIFEYLADTLFRSEK